MSRVISVDGPLRVISVEDVVAYEARLLVDLDASVPVPAKHADDYLRLAGLVKLSNMETAWQDHRKPTRPLTFDETNQITQSVDRNSSRSPDQSSIFERHRREL